MTDTTLAPAAARQTRLSVFGVIGTSLQTFASAPMVFLITALLVQMPPVLMLLLAPARNPREINVTGIVVAIVTMLIMFFAQAVMTRMTLRLLERERVDVGDAFQVGLQRYLPVLVTVILATLASYLAMILLIVPGLIVACMYAVCVPVCVLERKGPFDSLKRSGVLTKNMRWRVAAIFGVFLGLTLLVTLPTTYLVTLRGHPALGQWISVAVQFLYIPFGAIFPAVTYFELRRLKENAGIEHVFD